MFNPFAYMKGLVDDVIGKTWGDEKGEVGEKEKEREKMRRLLVEKNVGETSTVAQEDKALILTDALNIRSLIYAYEACEDEEQVKEITNNIKTILGKNVFSEKNDNERNMLSAYCNTALTVEFLEEADRTRLQMTTLALFNQSEECKFNSFDKLEQQINKLDEFFKNLVAQEKANKIEEDCKAEEEEEERAYLGVATKTVTVDVRETLKNNLIDNLTARRKHVVDEEENKLDKSAPDYLFDNHDTDQVRHGAIGSGVSPKLPKPAAIVRTSFSVSPPNRGLHEIFSDTIEGRKAVGSSSVAPTSSVADSWTSVSMIARDALVREAKEKEEAETKVVATTKKEPKPEFLEKQQKMEKLFAPNRVKEVKLAQEEKSGIFDEVKNSLKNKLKFNTADQMKKTEELRLKKLIHDPRVSIASEEDSIPAPPPVPLDGASLFLVTDADLEKMKTSLADFAVCPLVGAGVDKEVDKEIEEKTPETLEEFVKKDAERFYNLVCEAQECNDEEAVKEITLKMNEILGNPALGATEEKVIFFKTVTGLIKNVLETKGLTEKEAEKIQAQLKYVEQFKDLKEATKASGEDKIEIPPPAVLTKSVIKVGSLLSEDLSASKASSLPVAEAGVDKEIEEKTPETLEEFVEKNAKGFYDLVCAMQKCGDDEEAVQEIACKMDEIAENPLLRAAKDKGLFFNAVTGLINSALETKSLTEKEAEYLKKWLNKDLEEFKKAWVRVEADVAEADVTELEERRTLEPIEGMYDFAAESTLKRKKIVKEEQEEAAKTVEEKRVKLEEEARLKREEADRVRLEEAAKKEAEAEKLRLAEVAKKDAEDKERVRLEEEARKEADRVRLEEVERVKREAAERIKLEEAERIKREEEARLKREEADRLKLEEEERVKREEAERLEREEAERLEREEAERIKLEEAERIKLEEEARLKREEEDRLKLEEEDRVKREEAERLEREEAERLEREEAERIKREEAERLKLEEAERIKREEEERVRAEEAKDKERVRLEEEARKEAEEKLRLEEVAKKEAEEKHRLEEEAKTEAEDKERVRLEEEAKKEAEDKERVRLEEEARKEAEEKLRLAEVAKKEAEEKERVRLEAEAERLRLAEEERVRLEEEARKEAEERLRLEEVERLRVEEVERLRLEEVERLRLEEVERLRLEEERVRREEVERLRLEEVERLRLEEVERLRVEEERVRREEAERLRVEEVERLRAAREAAAALFHRELEAAEREDRERVEREEAAALFHRELEAAAREDRERAEREEVRLRAEREEVRLRAAREEARLRAEREAAAREEARLRVDRDVLLYQLPLQQQLERAATMTRAQIAMDASKTRKARGF